MQNARANSYLVKVLFAFDLFFSDRNSRTDETAQPGASPWTLRIADMCAGVAGQLIGEKRNVLEFRNKPSSLKKFLEPSCAYRLKKFERQSIDKLLGKRIWARTHSAGVDMMIIDERLSRVTIRIWFLWGGALFTPDCGLPTG